jgi:hypothetical protein
MAKTSYISIIISKKNNANFSCIMAKTSYISIIISKKEANPTNRDNIFYAPLLGTVLLVSLHMFYILFPFYK